MIKNLKRAEYYSVWTLLLFAVLNPFVAQAGWYLWPEGIGGLSLMQWFQGMVFLFAFGIYVFSSKTLLGQNTSLVILKR
jgi:hypothetical protein